MTNEILVYPKAVVRCLDQSCRKVLRDWCRSGFCNKCRSKKNNRQIADENLKKLGILKFRICHRFNEFFYSDKNRSKICNNCSKAKKRKENSYSITFIKSEIQHKKWLARSVI
jgi:hypothetical protein